MDRLLKNYLAEDSDEKEEVVVKIVEVKQKEF